MNSVALDEEAFSHLFSRRRGNVKTSSYYDITNSRVILSILYLMCSP